MPPGLPPGAPRGPATGASGEKGAAGGSGARAGPGERDGRGRSDIGERASRGSRGVRNEEVSSQREHSTSARLSRIYLGGVSAEASEADILAYVGRYVTPRNVVVSRSTQNSLYQLSGVPYCVFFDVEPPYAEKVLCLDGCYFRGGRLVVQRARRPEYSLRPHPWDQPEDDASGVDGGFREVAAAGGLPASRTVAEILRDLPWRGYAQHAISPRVLDAVDVQAIEAAKARADASARDSARSREASQRGSPESPESPACRCHRASGSVLAPAPIINKKRRRVLPV